MALEITNPDTCGLGQGEGCCAFLVFGAGFECGREEEVIAATVRARLAAGTVRAKYDPGSVPFPDCQERE